jgi:hypothetical protein
MEIYDPSLLPDSFSGKVFMKNKLEKVVKEKADYNL